MTLFKWNDNQRIDCKSFQKPVSAIEMLKFHKHAYALDGSIARFGFIYGIKLWFKRNAYNFSFKIKKGTRIFNSKCLCCISFVFRFAINCLLRLACIAFWCTFVFIGRHMAINSCLPYPTFKWIVLFLRFSTIRWNWIIDSLCFWFRILLNKSLNYNSFLY